MIENEIFYDEVVGELSFHKSSYRDYYEGKYKGIDIHIENKLFISDIHKLVVDLEILLNKINEYISKNFIELEAFLESKIDKKKFLDCVKLKCIMIQELHKFIFWINNDFLSGHCICIYGDIINGINFNSIVIEG